MQNNIEKLIENTAQQWKTNSDFVYISVVPCSRNIYQKLRAFEFPQQSSDKLT